MARNGTTGFETRLWLDSWLYKYGSGLFMHFCDSNHEV